MTKLAIIRIIGQQGLTKELKSTFKLLGLHKKYTCVIISNKPQMVGMIKKIKDLATWGEIDKETALLLLEQRGKLPGNVKLTKEYVKEKTKLDLDKFIDELFEGKKKIRDIPGLKPYFRLTPPRGGFERKGTKRPFTTGGVLGYRKSKINDLIQKMI